MQSILHGLSQPLQQPQEIVIFSISILQVGKQVLLVRDKPQWQWLPL
jgi:hypothetical protein